jgi:hypothetical protein
MCVGLILLCGQCASGLSSQHVLVVVVVFTRILHKRSCVLFCGLFAVLLSARVVVLFVVVLSECCCEQEYHTNVPASYFVV